MIGAGLMLLSTALTPRPLLGLVGSERVLRSTTKEVVANFQLLGYREASLGSGG